MSFRLCIFLVKMYCEYDNFVYLCTEKYNVFVKPNADELVRMLR